MALLHVVGQQLLEVAVKDPDAGDDFAGSRCPCERLRVAVPVLDVRLDRLDEHAKGGERAAPDRLVMILNQLSTWFNQELPVGVKCKLTPGCLASQSSTSSPL